MTILVSEDAHWAASPPASELQKIPALSQASAASCKCRVDSCQRLFAAQIFEVPGGMSRWVTWGASRSPERGQPAFRLLSGAPGRWLSWLHPGLSFQGGPGPICIPITHSRAHHWALFPALFIDKPISHQNPLPLCSHGGGNPPTCPASVLSSRSP